MNSTPPKKDFHLEPFRWKSIIKYLLQGLLVIAPIAVTIYAIYWIVSTVDNWLPIFRQPVKDFEGHTIGYEVKNYGLGFVIVIVSVILIGYLSSFFIQSRLFSLFDKWLEKTPGVKYIYSSVRDFFEAFAGEKKKFDKPVLANVDDTGCVEDWFYYTKRYDSLGPAESSCRVYTDGLFHCGQCLYLAIKSSKTHYKHYKFRCHEICHQRWRYACR